MNFQSVMDSPERVSLVIPPSTTKLATQALHRPSHAAIACLVLLLRPCTMRGRLLHEPAPYMRTSCDWQAPTHRWQGLSNIGQDSTLPLYMACQTLRPCQCVKGTGKHQEADGLEMLKYCPGSIEASVRATCWLAAAASASSAAKVALLRA